MSKRPLDGERDGRPPKRPKQDNPNQQKRPPEEIQFARQLRGLLVFRQDGILELRHGIASFKALLDNILYPKDENSRPRQLSILREYLESEKPLDANASEQPFLDQLWQAWSFAGQNHNDQLASSVGAIIALLLKVLSNVLDLREHGLLLCRTVLQNQHLRLIKRCLDAPKGKEFVMSPCLRLLIEVASFDGGVMAKELYRKRELTFDSGTMKRNLGLIRTDIPEAELHRKSSIRTWSVRYVLTLLKYLHEGGKIDILNNRSVCAALFAHLRVDPADLITELLDLIEKQVLRDPEVPRSAKSSLLTQQTLERITEVATRSHDDHPIAQKAFDWLKAVCTKPDYGLIRASGWYPPGTDHLTDVLGSNGVIDLGLDSLEFYDHDSRPEIRNGVALQWLLHLQPHNNLKERELLLASFESAPELVAAYFTNRNMSFDPKLTNTWVGYASLLFEVVQLPIPAYLGNEKEWAELPPQTTIMVESILPRPLTQKILTRCLVSNSELITFFVVRILIVAFEKLSKIRKQLKNSSESSGHEVELWQAASERLLSRFIERCPNMRQVDILLRKMPKNDAPGLQSEAVARLLQLYHEVTPLLALEEKLDISVPLIEILEEGSSEETPGEVRELKALELEHLLQIAKQKPDMRWLNKQGSLTHSPLMTLLRIHLKAPQNRPIRSLIEHVLIENSILNEASACEALIASLNEVQDYAFDSVATFLDDCFARTTSRPVKYLDDLEALFEPLERHCRIFPSLLVAVLIEQAPFVAAKSAAERDAIVPWMGKFLDLSIHSERDSIVQRIISRAKASLGLWTTSQSNDRVREMLLQITIPHETSDLNKHTTSGESSNTDPPFASPPVETEDHPELFKWAKKDIDIALEDGLVDALILCLCSQYSDVRTQAHSQLYKLQESLHYSNMEDKEPLYVVLGELIETYEHHCVPKSEALPYLAGTFATKALHVQMQPAHFMYTKVNNYLNKGPEWRIQKLPKYWIEHTILSEPQDDDAYWKEAAWVLSWLVDGLRTSADLDILRRANVYERVMSFCGSPGAMEHEGVKKQVLELLWRASFVQDGSTTLITRTGVLTWLDSVRQYENGIERVLKKRLLEHCDKKKIEQWSGMSIDDLMG